MREHVAPSDLVNVDTEDKGGVERSGSHRWRLVCVARGGKLSRIMNAHTALRSARPRARYAITKSKSRVLYDVKTDVIVKHPPPRPCACRRETLCTEPQPGARAGRSSHLQTVTVHAPTAPPPYWTC